MDYIRNMSEFQLETQINSFASRQVIYKANLYLMDINKYGSEGHMLLSFF